MKILFIFSVVLSTFNFAIAANLECPQGESQSMTVMDTMLNGWGNNIGEKTDSWLSIYQVAHQNAFDDLAANLATVNANCNSEGTGFHLLKKPNVRETSDVQDAIDKGYCYPSPGMRECWQYISKEVLCCGPTPSMCGDAICDGNEDENNCPTDCGSNTGTCGDAICDAKSKNK